MNRTRALMQGATAVLVGLVAAAALGLAFRVFAWTAGL